MTYRLGILSTHPIQYYSPWYRAMAARDDVDLTVYYAHRPTGADQAAAGFGVAFEWDVPLLEGYSSVYLNNRARHPNLSGFLGCHTPEIAEIVRRERFHAFIVHGWYNRSYWQAMRACWQTGTPLLVRGDSTLAMAPSHWRRLAKWMTHRWFIPRFDAYLVVGQRAREYYLAHGADARKMFFVPHFVDNDRFAQAAAEARPQRAELRRRWNLPQDAVVFLFAGKFIPKKRPLDFVKAMAAVVRSVPRAAGLMVGDGPLRGEIEAKVLSSESPIRLAGFLNQTTIPSAYAAADVLVLPSEGTETWGLVVNEAMACGLPALVSDQVGCGPDLIWEGETGFVFRCGDVAQMADQMIRLAQSPPVAARLGAAAHELVQRYSVDVATEGTTLALAQVVPREASPVTFGTEVKGR